MTPPDPQQVAEIAGREVWKNDQPAGEFFGMMRLHVSGDRWIHSVGTGPAVEAAILRKKEEAR